ncbi:predicted protein [Thalassiosira pseudonana CCMP1335]|uniref:Cytochrome b561 domain-containing protein n=1 Tax=Thalassiosira pseudonana TaxID=35128 RepID=B8LEC5_THAPS|nr:predicted protein [Thalassiosira pseudonana CCMP1335]EED86347.1 predicted protein [Thalassiosira pseudonana CCMP1335]
MSNVPVPRPYPHCLRYCLYRQHQHCTTPPPYPPQPFHNTGQQSSNVIMIASLKRRRSHQSIGASLVLLVAVVVALSSSSVRVHASASHAFGSPTNADVDASTNNNQQVHFGGDSQRRLQDDEEEIALEEQSSEYTTPDESASTEKSTPSIYDPDEYDAESPIGDSTPPKSSSFSSSTNISYQSTGTTTSSNKKSAWIAHGTIATLAFGLLVPTAISSALFRELLPTYWIYIHVFLNVATFALTFFTVGIAFATMNGMGDESEGHLKELHHIVGLALLLLVSFQTANGFLRPPREFVTDDEEDSTPGAIQRGMENKLTPRRLWHLVHSVNGIFLFAMGTYQVSSGLGLFAKRYGGMDWGSVYLGYIGWVAAMIVGGRVWLKLRERKRRMEDWKVDGSASGGGLWGDDAESNVGHIHSERD